MNDDEAHFSTDGDIRLPNLEYPVLEFSAYRGSYVDNTGIMVHPRHVWDDIPIGDIGDEIMPRGCDAYLGPRGWLIRERLVLDLHAFTEDAGIEVFERFKETMCGTMGTALDPVELDTARGIYALLVERDGVPSAIVWLAASGCEYI